MTKNEILGEILQRWCYGNEEYIKPAYKEFCKTDALTRRKVWHSIRIEPDFIFSEIDSVIHYLQSLKEEGYTCLLDEAYNYGEYAITACKHEEETDDEYYNRLRDYLHCIIEQRIELETKSNAKAARIAELKAELKRLESE